MLLGGGRGFEIGQVRLGSGSIHHCIRLIGLAERALERMCRRTASRIAFGARVSDQSVTQEQIAEAGIMIEEARLLTLKAAWMMDTRGNKEARSEIAMIKVAAPSTDAGSSAGRSRPLAAPGSPAITVSPTPMRRRACCASPTGPTSSTATRSPDSNCASTEAPQASSAARPRYCRPTPRPARAPRRCGSRSPHHPALWAGDANAET
jgi:Acyl-CoA dehydrogenase, C-terminal domain